MASYYAGKTGNYTIKSGDNLSRIAKSSGVSVSELAKWNNISNVNNIRAGAKLYTYDPTANKQASAVPATQAKASSAPAQTSSVIQTINGVKTVNENRIADTGASEVSTVPTATTNMEKNGVEYSWTKEGKVQGFLEQQMKDMENRAQLIDNKSKINYGGSRQEAEISEYAVNQTQNKMGITGDAALDMDRMVEVANNARAYELYSAEELLKYGEAAGKRTSKMYGDLKARQVTLEQYKSAWEVAEAEANLTGIFKDPIQLELSNQKDVASAIIKSPYASQAEKTRAQKIVSGVNNAFLELGISEKGQDTLTKIHNAEMVRLQERQINASLAGVAEMRRSRLQAGATASADLIKGMASGMDYETFKKAYAPAARISGAASTSKAWEAYKSSHTAVEKK